MAPQATVSLGGWEPLYERAGDGSSAGRVRDGIQTPLSSSVSHTLGPVLSLKRSETPRVGSSEGWGTRRRRGLPKPACLHVDDHFQLGHWDGFFYQLL